MVMSLPKPKENHKTLFQWLTPCVPAAGIAARSGINAPKPLAPKHIGPKPLGKWQRRWLAGAFGTSQAVALALGLWMPSLWQQTTEIEPPPDMSEEQRLWEALGSDELAEALLTAKLQQADEQKAEAEQALMQAQQLRIDAEAQAQALVTAAAAQARETTFKAVRQSQLIALDATFIGAEQVLYADSGDAVTLKFTANVQCKAGAFGMTAVATPTDQRIAPREVRNLGKCFPSVETAAGEAIGEVGKWGIAFFKLDGPLENQR